MLHAAVDKAQTLCCSSSRPIRTRPTKPALRGAAAASHTQRVIVSLQYNHIPGYLYNVSKSRPFSRIMDTARDTLKEALPIKCIEVGEPEGTNPWRHHLSFAVKGLYHCM